MPNEEKIEKVLKVEKWQERWEKRLYEPDLDKAEKPFYNLMMFPILLPKDCMSAMSMPSPARIFTAVFNDCKETMF